MESQPKCPICYKVADDTACTQCSKIFTSVIESLTKVSTNPFSNIDNLVFQGGGVKGAAYLGVLEQLNKESKGFLTRVKRVAGSSAGSIVALYLALNLDLKYIGELVKEKYSNLLDGGMGLIIKGENKKVRAKVVFLTTIKYFKELKDEVQDEEKSAKALLKIKKIAADIKSYYTSDLWIHEKFLFNKVIGDRAAEAFTSCILDLLGVSYVIKSAKRKTNGDEKVEFEEELVKGFLEAQEKPATERRRRTAAQSSVHELEKVPGAQGERKVRRLNNDSEKESSELEESPGNSKRQKSKTRGFGRKKESKKESSESEEDSDDDSELPKPKAQGSRRTQKSEDESLESEEDGKVYQTHTVRQVQFEKKTIRQGERTEVQESQVKTVRLESHRVTAKRTSGPESITEFDLSDENGRKLLHYALAELVLKIKDFQEDRIEYKYDTSKVEKKMDDDELADHLDQNFDIPKDQSKKEPLGVFTGDKVKHRLIIEPIEAAFKKFDKKTGPHGPTFAELAAAKDKKEKKLFKDLYVTAFNCATNRTEVFSAEHTPNVFVADAVRASMSIPGFFKPVHISQKVGETVENRRIYFEKKNEVRDEDVLFMDGGILDNYPLWIFDDIKYLLSNVKLNAKSQEARTQRFSIQNQKTLGFKLLDQKTLDRYTKPYIKDNLTQMKRTNEASQATGNKWTFVFGSLLGAKMDQEENEFIKFGNCPRTVYVDNADVSAVAFDMDEKVVDKLIKNGEESAKKYKERYEKRFLHEGETYPAYTC